MDNIERTVELLKIAQEVFVEAINEITPMNFDKNTIKYELEELKKIEGYTSIIQHWASEFIELRNKRLQLLGLIEKEKEMEK